MKYVEFVCNMGATRSAEVIEVEDDTTDEEIVAMFTEWLEAQTNAGWGWVEKP